MSETITPPISDRICKHRNKDHGDAVLFYLGLSAVLLSLHLPAAAQNCRPLSLLGGEGSEVTKTVSQPTLTLSILKDVGIWENGKKNQATSRTTSSKQLRWKPVQ